MSGVSSIYAAVLSISMVLVASHRQQRPTAQEYQAPPG